MSSNISFAQTGLLKVYKGSMDNKYTVEMHLRIINDTTVYGYYYYLKYMTPMALNGLIKADSIILYEPDFPDNNIFFRGLVKNNIIAGTWNNKHRNETLSFNVGINDSMAIHTIKEYYKIDSLYHYDFSNDSYQYLLDMHYIDNDRTYFDILTSTQSGCIGYVSGIANFTSLHFGQYHGEGCKKLTFSQVGKAVQIIEDDCNKHGSRCGFTHAFSK